MALLEGSLRVTRFVDAAEYRGLAERSDLVGDGERTSFLVSHSFGSPHVAPALYDSRGRPVYAASRPVGSSEILISFFYQPRAGETFTLVVRR